LETFLNTALFEARLKEWSVPFAVVADLETGDAIRIGCSKGLGFDDLEANLFRDADSVFATGRSLDGQFLPRIWSQGTISCIVCKPDEKTMVGLFFSDQLNPVEKYYRSKQLNSQVLSTFNEIKGSKPAQ
jgi:hypothetical protein